MHDYEIVCLLSSYEIFLLCDPTQNFSRDRCRNKYSLDRFEEVVAVKS